MIKNKLIIALFALGLMYASENSTDYKQEVQSKPLSKRKPSQRAFVVSTAVYTPQK